MRLVCSAGARAQPRRDPPWAIMRHFLFGDATVARYGNVSQPRSSLRRRRTQRSRRLCRRSPALRSPWQSPRLPPLARPWRRYSRRTSSPAACASTTSSWSRHGAAWRARLRCAWRGVRQPYARSAAVRSDAPRDPPQVRELLAAEPDNEEYTDLQTSLLEVRDSRASFAARVALRGSYPGPGSF